MEKELQKDQFKIVEVPRFSIDIVHITARELQYYGEAYPDQKVTSDTGSEGSQTNEYAMNLDLMTNAFGVGFDFHHPQLSNLTLYPFQDDNVARRIDSYDYVKHFDHETKEVLL